MVEISITRALTELKTLKNRYEKSIRELDLMAVKQGNKLRSPRAYMKEEDFVKKAESGLQSSHDLYRRIIDIKTAIDKSNFTTVIKVGKLGEMTVQEALVYKKYIDLKKLELSKLRKLSVNEKSDYEEAIKENQLSAEKMVASTIGKEGTDQQKAAARKEAED